MLVMNRSNSFVTSLKWWPLQGHNNNSNSNNNCNNQSNLHTHTHQLHHNNNNSNKTCNFGSSVAVQKLRESKWFQLDERRIFCAVVECGFIVEVRAGNADNNKAKLLKHMQTAAYAEDVATSHGSNADDADDDDDSFILGQDENVRPMTSTWFGVVLCKTAKDNKPKPETIEIYTVKIRENGTFKMLRLPLEDIWKNGWELRINNFADKEKSPHNEKDIRNQVSFARKAKQSLWNNNKHFAYWCRYGSRQQDVRKRQMSECVKWGSVGMNAGMLLVMNKQKSLSASK